MSEKEKEKEKEKENVVTEKVVSEADELPKTIVRRVVKDKLSQLSMDSEVSVLRDSLQGFCESARIFIHFLSATANDVCKESNRQIINAEDVFKALEEIEFAEFAPPLRTSLEGQYLSADMLVAMILGLELKLVVLLAIGFHHLDCSAHTTLSITDQMRPSEESRVIWVKASFPIPPIHTGDGQLVLAASEYIHKNDWI